jgi:hypothetical protein
MTHEDAAHEAAAEEETPETPKESAFDRTQQVLENLQKRRAGTVKKEAPATEPTQAEAEPVVEQEVEAAPSTPKETAFDRTQQVLENLQKRRETKSQEAVAQAQPAAVSRDDLKRLSDEVLELRDQMQALRDEIQALRALSSQTSAAMDNVSIEEVA